MPQVNGRSLDEVRRYDLFKLTVAVLLFIAWLFFTDRVPMLPGDSPEPVVPADTAGNPAVPVPAAVPPSPLRIESAGGRIHLRGSVPDDATRGDYVAAARNALGRADRIDDDLVVADGASGSGGPAHVGPAISAIVGHDGVSAMVDGDQVVLEGSVADEAQRTGLADRVTAAFGAPFTIVNRLTIAEPAPAPVPAAPVSAPALASIPASASAPAPATIPPAVAAATPAPGTAAALQVVPAPVSVFFDEGVAVVGAADGEKLAPLVRHAREAGASLRVSGYHSSTGSAQRNAEIAKERAVAVRDLLVGLGVAADRIILDKPRETLGEADGRRARRVDVAIDDQ